MCSNSKSVEFSTVSIYKVSYAAITRVAFNCVFEDQLVDLLTLLQKKLSIKVGTVAIFILYVTINAGGAPEIYTAIIL